MIDIPRYLLIGAIAVLSYMLLIEWSKFDPEAAVKANQQTQASAQQPSSTNPTSDFARDTIASSAEVPDTAEMSADIPSAAEFSQADMPGEPTTQVMQIDGLITVKTDVLNVLIDPNGGDIIEASLPKHYAELETPDVAFKLLEQGPRRTFIAQSGLSGPNGTDTAKGRPQFEASSENFSLADGQDSLQVDLRFTQDNGVTVVKRYTFTRGEYLIDLDYIVNNNSNSKWQAALFTQLKRDNSKDPSSESSSALGMQPFLGAAYTSPEKRFNKLRLGKIQDGDDINLNMNNAWAGIIQHYFVAAWISPPEQTSNIRVFATRTGQNMSRVSQGIQTIESGESGTLSAKLYAGPKDQYRLEEISSGLELTVDYGILWWIAQPLFWLMVKIHSVLGNWGFTIISVTLLVKICFFQLNATAFKSMANMRRVQPKLVALKERYGDDKAKQSQEMMALYKKEKINPLGGCLPMLVQMPVFIALYWVLMESVELRHAPWILWIEDLSTLDPYFILPLLMGASMFIQQKLNPPPPDPMQAKVMQILPVIFTVFFLFFPAGLVLYWVVNNVLSIAQQYVITKNIEKNAAK